MKRVSLLAFFCFLLLSACKFKNNDTSQKLIIFNAGSLSLPIKIISDSFMKLHPEVKIIPESGGSLVCARKITELQKPCDIFFSADYQVINDLIKKGYADSQYYFASNEMVIVYNSKSKFATEINKDNWYEILLKKEVKFGRSDPNSDPCGYRAVLSILLAEKYYKQQSIVKLLKKDLNCIRPKEIDLFALLETSQIDYMITYKSIAKQHKIPFIELPDSINLSNNQLNAFYRQASTEIKGVTPTEKKTVQGECILYSFAFINKSPNPNIAKEFVDFFNQYNKTILTDCGFKSINFEEQ